MDEVTLDNTKVGDILIFSSNLHNRDFDVEVIEIIDSLITVKVLSDIKYCNMTFDAHIGFRRLKRKKDA